MKKVFLIAVASTSLFTTLQAQITTRIWDGGGSDNLWSNNLNWGGDNIPDTIAEKGQFNGLANVLINITNDYSINSYTDGFAGAGFTHSLYSSNGSTLTIDLNASGFGIGMENATGNAGSTFRIGSGNIIIDNSQGGVTAFRNANSSGNTFLFDTNSTLTINTPLQTVNAAGGSIQMNGTFASSAADLQVNSTNVSFGTGHDSTGFGRDLVMFNDSKLAVDGGTVLNSGRKFQVNGDNAELELNGADAINDANINVGGTNSFLLDANADQADMGILAGIGGSLTIDLDPTVTLLAFDDSSAEDWGGGTVTIAGFQEGVIQFGTDANGLTAAQLGLIDGGAYTLDSTGFLTAVPEPSTFALLAGVLALGFIVIRRRHR